MMAESSRAEAARCCACRECGAAVANRWDAFWGSLSGVCESCAPIVEERIRVSNEQLASMLETMPGASRSLCPMCGHPEDE